MAEVVIEGAQKVDSVYEAVDMSLCVMYVTVSCLLMVSDWRGIISRRRVLL